MKAAVLVLVVWAVPAWAQSERATHVAIGVAMVGQFTDITTTMYGMGAGQFQEANPLLRWAEHRPVAMGVTKGAVAVGVSAALLKAQRRHPKAAFWTAVGVAVVQGLVTYHNARLLRKD